MLSTHRICAYKGIHPTYPSGTFLFVVVGIKKLFENDWASSRLLRKPRSRMQHNAWVSSRLTTQKCLLTVNTSYFIGKAINGDASGADRHRLAGRHIGKLAGRQDIKSLRQSEQCKKAGHGKQGGP